MFITISARVITRKKIKIRLTDKTWYNNYLRRLRRVKDRDHKTWTRNKTDLNWDIYKASRNQYFQECDRIIIEYEEHIYATLADEIDKKKISGGN